MRKGRFSEEQIVSILREADRDSVAQGVDERDLEKLPALLKLSYGGTSDAMPHLGCIQKIKGLFLEFQKYLHRDKASL